MWAVGESRCAFAKKTRKANSLDGIEKLNLIGPRKSSQQKMRVEFFLRRKSQALDHIAIYLHSNTVFMIRFTEFDGLAAGF